MPPPFACACSPICQLVKEGRICFPCTHCNFFPSVVQPARTKLKPQKEDLDQPLDRPAAILQFWEGWTSNTCNCHLHIPLQNKETLACTPARLFSALKCWKLFLSRKILHKRHSEFMELVWGKAVTLRSEWSCADIRPGGLHTLTRMLLRILVVSNLFALINSAWEAFFLVPNLQYPLKSLSCWAIYFLLYCLNICLWSTLFLTCA